MNIFLPILIAISLSVPAKPVVFNNGTFTVNLTYPNSNWIEVYKLPAGTMEDEVCDLVDYWHAQTVVDGPSVHTEFQGEYGDVIAVLTSESGCETSEGFYEDFFTAHDYSQD